jgi:hypothetical protein
MARVKCPKLDRFTLLVVKVYNLRNEFNFEIDNEPLIKNAENNQNVFYFQESKEGLGGYYK